MLSQTVATVEIGAASSQRREPFLVPSSILLAFVLYLYLELQPYRESPLFALCIQGGIALLLSGWLIWKVRWRQKLACSPLALPAVALVMTSIVATLFSIDQRISWASSLGLLAQVLLFFLVCDLLLAGWNARVFVDALILVGTLLLSEGLAQTCRWYWQWWELRVPEYPLFPLPLRLSGVASTNPNILAGLLIMFLPFAIVRLGLAPSRLASLVWASWLLAADVVLFFTGSRGGWLAAVVEVLICVGWLAMRAGPNWNKEDVAGWMQRRWRLWAATAGYLGLFLLLHLSTTSASPLPATTHDPLVSQEPMGRLSIWTVALQDFLSHPLTGSGPGTYPWVFVSQTATSSSGDAIPFAHNLFLGVLSEQGLLGMLAVGWGLLVAAQVLGRALLRSLPASAGSCRDSRLLVGVAASLAGVFTHSQVDAPAWLPVIALMVIMLLALGMHFAGMLKPPQGRLSRWTALLLIFPLLLSPVLWQQVVAHSALMTGAALAARGDWLSAARSLDKAVELDPSLTLYHEQRGYAYGVLAAPLDGSGDPAALREALASYNVALRHGPVRVETLVNAAELARRAGQADEADRLLAAALPRDGGRQLPALLLADRYAARGMVPEARSLLSTALDRAPCLAVTAAVRSSELGRPLASQLPPCSTPAPQSAAPIRGIPIKEQAIDILKALSAAPTSSPDYRVWLARSQAHVSLDQKREAAYSLALASKLAPASDPLFAVTTASLLEAAGEREQAIEVLERSVLPGSPQAGYGSFVYSRTALPGALLPRPAMQQRTEDDLAAYRELSALYLRNGLTDEAARVERDAVALARLLEAPD